MEDRLDAPGSRPDDDNPECTGKDMKKSCTVEPRREASERYLGSRRWQRIMAYRQECAHEMGLTEADVPRLITEYRDKTSHHSWRNFGRSIS